MFNTQRATLPDDFGSEIEFIVGRADARTELHDHVRGIGAETFHHLADRICHDTKFSAFASGMHKADSRCVRIYNVNCATVGDINTECDATLVADNAVAAREFTTHRAAAIAVDYCYFITVNLFGGEQRPVAKSGRAANFAMCGIEPLQHFGFFV